MGISKIKFGKHEDVLWAEFGSADITFSRAKYPDEERETMVLFHNKQGEYIGAETEDWKGVFSDDLPKPEFVMKFNKPESITALIHTLIELQKEFFKPA